MSLFCVICTDKPGALDLRLSTRPDHVAFLKTRIDMVRLAGPRLDDEGKMCGSLFVVEADSKAAVEAFNADDPYSKAGLFASVQISGFNASLGSWVG